MKVLFLDIDGVLNSRKYLKRKFMETGRGGTTNIDPVPAALVRRIIDETGCRVVLSSTWRLAEKLRQKVRDDVCEFVGVTGNYGGEPRGYEVEQWVTSHPEVECYAILDDDSDFLKHQPLFKTTFELGLTQEIAEDVIKHLNNGKIKVDKL